VLLNIGNEFSTKKNIFRYSKKSINKQNTFFLFSLPGALALVDQTDQLVVQIDCNVVLNLDDLGAYPLDEHVDHIVLLRDAELVLKLLLKMRQREINHLNFRHISQSLFAREVAHPLGVSHTHGVVVEEAEGQQAELAGLCLD